MAHACQRRILHELHRLHHGGRASRGCRSGRGCSRCGRRSSRGSSASVRLCLPGGRPLAIAAGIRLPTAPADHRDRGHAIASGRSHRRHKGRGREPEREHDLGSDHGEEATPTWHPGQGGGNARHGVLKRLMCVCVEGRGEKARVGFCDNANFGFSQQPPKPAFKCRCFSPVRTAWAFRKCRFGEWDGTCSGLLACT